MHRKKSRSNGKNFLVVGVLTTLAIGTISSLWLHTVPETVSNTVWATVPAAEEETIYPALYSDAHITENAIDTNPQFANSVVFSPENQAENQVASALNSVSIQTSQPSRLTGLENGTWLWTPIMEITPKYRDEIISGAKKNGIKNIYLSIDSYLDIFIMGDGPEKDAKKKAFNDIVEGFIKEAHKNSITVDAEGGWRNWAEEGNLYKPFAILGYAIQFNKTHTEKFRGFQYDVEPYLLDNYKKDKVSILNNFLTLINQSVSKLNKSDLQLSVVIPEFYDSSDTNASEFVYLGKSGYAIDHLLRILDRRPGSNILVMSYRNFNSGKDGTIEISKDEIYSANTSKSKIIIAQETGDVEPPYITYHNTSKKYYEKQLEALKKAFGKEKSYGGVATHYINAFLALK